MIILIMTVFSFELEARIGSSRPDPGPESPMDYIKTYASSFV
jgi:hypothetical protein